MLNQNLPRNLHVCTIYRVLDSGNVDVRVPSIRKRIPETDEWYNSDPFIVYNIKVVHAYNVIVKPVKGQPALLVTGRSSDTEDRESARTVYIEHSWANAMVFLLASSDLNTSRDVFIRGTDILIGQEAGNQPVAKGDDTDTALGTLLSAINTIEGALSLPTTAPLGSVKSSHVKVS